MGRAEKWAGESLPASEFLTDPAASGTRRFCAPGGCFFRCTGRIVNEVRSMDPTNSEKKTNRSFQSAIVFSILVAVLGAGVAFGFRIFRAENEAASSQVGEPRLAGGRPDGTAALSPARGIPGEFESHEGLLVVWRDAVSRHPDRAFQEEMNKDARRTILDLIQLVRNNIQVVLIVQSEAERQEARLALKRERIPPESVQIVDAPFDTAWIRDYGPTSIRSAKGGSRWVHADFRSRSIRPRDRKTAPRLAKVFGQPGVRAPFHVDGGNLLSNGRGLVLTTTAMLHHNRLLGYSRSDVERMLKQYYGAERVVFLEPLYGEPNGHVDMFAAFTAADTVVLGQYDIRQDPINQAVLERNTKRLAEVATDTGKLRVVRIPMPPRSRQKFYGGTYTNVVFANGLLIVPRFGKVDPAGRDKAVAVYRRLLPDWKVVTLDAEAWITLGGSLHCLTKTVHQLDARPASGESPIFSPTSELSPAEEHTTPIGPL